MTFKRQEDITRPQAEVYEYVIKHVSRHGFQPMMTKIADAFGVTRRSIADRFHQLASKGYVSLPEKYQERCLRLNHVGFSASFVGTAKQKTIDEPEAELYEFIARYVEENGYQPSTAEAGEHFGVNRTTISNRLRKLAAGQYLTLPAKYGERQVRLKGVRFTPVFRNDP